MIPHKHTFSLRVRYADIDQMGVVYHSRYLEWFEAARTEMLRDMGLTYKSMENKGFLLPVIEAHCNYQLPVKYDDAVNVITELNEVSRLKIRLGYKVFIEGDERVRVKGYTLHCFMGPEGRAVRAPEEIMAYFRV